MAVQASRRADRAPGLAGPVRTLPGGEHSPAALFEFRSSRRTAGTPSYIFSFFTPSSCSASPRKLRRSSFLGSFFSIHCAPWSNHLRACSFSPSCQCQRARDGTILEPFQQGQERLPTRLAASPAGAAQPGQGKRKRHDSKPPLGCWSAQQRNCYRPRRSD
jgi:hypothetical protein